VHTLRRYNIGSPNGASGCVGLTNVPWARIRLLRLQILCLILAFNFTRNCWAAVSAALAFGYQLNYCWDQAARALSWQALSFFAFMQINVYFVSWIFKRSSAGIYSFSICMRGNDYGTKVALIFCRPAFVPVNLLCRLGEIRTDAVQQCATQTVVGLFYYLADTHIHKQLLTRGHVY